MPGRVPAQEPAPAPAADRVAQASPLARRSRPPLHAHPAWPPLTKAKKSVPKQKATAKKAVPHRTRPIQVIARLRPAEKLEHKPAADARLPKLRGADREIVKPRCVLTDDEIARFIACDKADLKLRILSLVARCEGGMRTSDLHAWTWTMIDVQNFETCTIPRCKTAAPNVLDVPQVLRPFLRAWWERAGCPTVGPVSPARKGDRAGERKSRMNSYAERLRRGLFRAGVVRMPPIEVLARRQGMRTDLGKRPAGTMLAPNPADPLYFETDTSLPVDFHSFRRAYNTALAAAGVNVQKAMHLAGHADAKTHMRYVQQTPAMRQVPVG